tara:strand:+ start:33771 stop:34775 length:1005 start_codon:yes stop_codon:yes gene_type:complete
MKRILIIAEAGVNHNGDIEIAKKLVDSACDAGADVIKFQSFKSEKLVTKNAEKAPYQLKDENREKSQFNMLKKLELNDHETIILKEYCKEKNIEFLSTAFDLGSLKFLKNNGLNRYKIPSGEITNFPFLREIAKINMPTIMSTGMANMQEIEEAIFCLCDFGLDKSLLTILHCTTEYPAPFNEVNLKAMQTIKNTFGISVGYSDHTLGTEVSISAAALGAEIIEKHITLNRNMNGPDHFASIEPDQFKKMVTSIRNIELALGNGIKRPTKSELLNKLVARKSIYAAVNISKGTPFDEKNIVSKRPEGGISPMQWKNLIGKKAKKDFLKDELIFF